MLNFTAQEKRPNLSAPFHARELLSAHASLSPLLSCEVSFCHSSLGRDVTVMELILIPLVAPHPPRRSSPTSVAGSRPPIAPPCHPSILSSARPLNTPCSAPTVMEMAIGARHGCRDLSTQRQIDAYSVLISHEREAISS
jgi:hypothetical protein